MNSENLELAKEIEFNEKAEAQAILDYTEFLRKLDILPNIDGLDKEFIKDTISEIISDELNHQEKLKMLYTTKKHKRFSKQPTAYLALILTRERRNAWVLIRIALDMTPKQRLLSIQKQKCLLGLIKGENYGNF